MPELLAAIGQLPTVLRHAVRSFHGKVDEVRSWYLRFDPVRVPLDIRRYNVTMAPRWTCDVLLINISSRDGLLEVCSNVDEWRTRTGKSTSPVLCDVDLYYRMLKLQYNVTHVSVATDSFFAHTPLLFGVWHSYKYCVAECYRRLLPLWAALEYKDFLTAPGTVQIVTNFNLSMMEQMVLAAFLAAGRVLPLLRDAQLNFQHRREIYGGGAVKLQQLSTLTTLFRDYAPALFYIGYQVQTLHWRRHTPWSGKEAYNGAQSGTILHRSPLCTAAQRGSTAVHGCITIGAAAVGSLYGCPSWCNFQ